MDFFQVDLDDLFVFLDIDKGILGLARFHLQVPPISACPD